MYKINEIPKRRQRGKQRAEERRKGASERCGVKAAVIDEDDGWEGLATSCYR